MSIIQLFSHRFKALVKGLWVPPRTKPARVMVLAAAATLSGAVAVAGPEEGHHSQWLKLVAGERCEETGAEIMQVTENPDTGTQSVRFKVPKKVVTPTDAMEEVRVVGQAPSEMELPSVLPEFETQWIDDPDDGHYGLLVTFSSEQKVPIRLEFYTDANTWDGATSP